MEQAEIVFGGSISKEQLGRIAEAIVAQRASADWAEPSIRTKKEAIDLLLGFVAEKAAARVVCDPGRQMSVLTSALQENHLSYVLDTGPAGDDPTDREIFEPSKSVERGSIGGDGPSISLAELRAEKAAGGTLDDILRKLSKLDAQPPPLILL